jgi:hypothetical protein
MGTGVDPSLANLSPPPASNGFMQGFTQFAKDNPFLTGAGIYTVASTTGMLDQNGQQQPQGEEINYTGPRLSADYKGGPYGKPNVYEERRYNYASGGITEAYQSGGPVERMSQMNTAMNPQGGLYPQGMIDKTQYATPTQRPVSAELMMEAPAYERSSPMLMASGGQVKGYAPGGQISDPASLNEFMRLSTEAKKLAQGQQVNPFAGGMPDFGNGSTFPNLPPMSGPLGAAGQAPAGGFNPFANVSQNNLRVQGGGYDQQGRPVDGLGAFLPGRLGSDLEAIANNTIARNDDMQLTEIRRAQQANNLGQSTGQSTFPGASSMQGGFGQGAQGYPSFASGSSGGSGGPFPLEGQYGIIKMAAGGIASIPRYYRGKLATSSGGRGDTYSATQRFLDMYDPQSRYQAPTEKGDPGIFRDTSASTRNKSAMDAAMTRQTALEKQSNVNTRAKLPRASRSAGQLNMKPQGSKAEKDDEYEYAASGGIMEANLGGYAAGGNPRLLKGPGDGMSDNIPAVIGRRQPARLADGEFVVPADVVSHLGNGSTDAGAKKLHGMMDNVRKARTGKKKQAPAVKTNKFIPK